MRIPLRLATALALAGCVLATTAAAWIVTRVVATDAMYAQGQRHLSAATVLGAARLSASQDAALDSVASVLALSTGYRVSVFDSDQRLLADSNLESLPTGAAASVTPRTEVAGALSRLRSSSIRVSALDGRRHLFSASRLYRGGERVVIRFGAPAQPIAEAASRVARWVAFAVFAAGSVGLLVLDRGAGGMVGVLHDIRRLLARLGESRPAGARVKLPRVVELARVASAANRVRGELEEQVAGVTRERDELAQLMDEVGEGLMALTNDARVLRINPAARQLLGLAEVIPFSPVGSIVRDPVLRDLLEASVVRAEGRLEVSVGDRELEVRTKRGTEGGAVVLLVDITEIRRLEAVRSDFVANASHELKTPLTVIRAAAETVLDEELPPDLRGQFLRSIEGNTVRLQRLVDDLLDLSRYESGAWRPEREPFPVGSVAWSAWEDMEEKWEGRGVSFAVEGEGEALGDEAAAYQIFRNLFENALRYVPSENARVRVEIQSSGGQLLVAVGDNGSGIPVSALPRIFERFYRVDTARSRDEGGTGLGLAIVRHLVSSMGGRVDATSGWGVGTTITFTVPSARPGEFATGVESDRAKTPGTLAVTALAWMVAACVASCGGDEAVVSVGGSGSLYPLSEAVAENFAATRPGARVTVGAFGSVGGLRRLCSGELDIAGASRPISTAESERCRAAGMAYLAIPIARDGIAVVVNTANAAVQCLTLDELRRLWEPSSAVTTWRDLRPAYPDEAIQLFGPGPGSGTFDFFTSVVVGRSGASRTDYYQTDGNNLIAHGVAGDRWALGYFGSAFFAANRDRLRTVAVDTGFGCVPPTDQAVSDGAYSPLSRDLYLYVADATLARPEVRDFVRHYVAVAERLSALTGYVPLPTAEYARSRAMLARARDDAP